MSALAPGTRAYLYYVGDNVWHCRILLAWVDAAEYVVCTPDYDIYLEEISAENDDLEGLRVGDASIDLPVGLTGQQVYQFNPPVAPRDLESLLLEGRRHAHAERQARGLAAAPGAPAGANANAPVVVPVPLPAVAVPGGPVVGPRVGGAAGTWVLDEPGPSGEDLGREVVLPVGFLDFGGRTFVTVDGRVASAMLVAAGSLVDEAVELRRAELVRGDERIFQRPTVGQPTSLHEAQKRMKAMVGFKPVIDGPATVAATLHTALERNSGGLVAAHDRWVQESGIEMKSRAVYEHKILSRAIQLGYAVDGLNVKNLHSFEYLNRRRQLLEDAHRHDPSKPDFEGSEFYMGEPDETAGVVVAGNLRSHVAAEFAKRSAIDKERRKAKEARAGAKK